MTRLARRGGMQEKPTSLIGKLISSVFMSIFAGFGIFFIALMVREELLDAIRVRMWDTTTCTVLAAGPLSEDENEGHAAYRVEYDYSYGGADYRGNYWRLKQGESVYARNVHEVEKAGRSYAPGTSTHCYVNPKDPSQAVLKRGDLAMLPFMLIPVVFIVIGFGGMFWVWKGSGDETEAISIKDKEPSRWSEIGGRVIGLLFFAAFFSIGTMFLWVTFGRAVTRMLVSESWEELTCTIESSDVTHAGDTCKLMIRYRYEWMGRTYRSETYNGMNMSSSGRKWKQRIVKEFPVGMKTHCRVDPDDPTRAILRRRFTRDMWVVLIPLVFIFIGGGGMIGVFMKTKENRALSSPLKRKSVRAGAERRDPRRMRNARKGHKRDGAGMLKARTGRGVKVLGTLAFAALWNSAVFFMVREVIEGFQKGRSEWFLTLFAIPFVIIGIVAIVFFCRSVLALFNPRPRLRFSRVDLCLGDTVDFTWGFEGHVDRLEAVEICLCSEERATYTRGTDTVTDTHMTLRRELVKTERKSEFKGGRLDVSIPADAMHSFKSRHNQIRWYLKVKGTIPKWPDIDSEYNLDVAPVRKQG